MASSTSIGGPARVALLAAGIITCTGCDTVRTTSQSVRIVVEDDRGLPVPNVKVSMKESWESWKSRVPGGIRENEEAYYRERWESEFVPWVEGVTNDKGNATLNVVETAIDDPRNDIPPAHRDWVSNREYIVKMRTSDKGEQLHIVMKAGMVSRGERYTVTIDDISEPKYVQ